MLINPRQFRMVLAALAMLSLTGCNSEQRVEESLPPVHVSVMSAEPSDLLVTKDPPARVTALRSAEIRAQIGGIVQHRLFEQGGDIQAGTVLFQINPAPFKAEVDVAAAALQRAEAVLNRTQLEVKRLATLTQTGVISRQVYDDAVSLRDQAAADVAQAKATLARNQLNLQFTRVEAPISGRIDQTLLSEGALVSPTDATPMARIQQIDQVYVDVRLPASVLDEMRQAHADITELAVEILSSNAKPLGMTGLILFSGIEVDTGTGDVLLRVQVDNPEHRLLPGLYVQARIPRAYYPDTLSVPQQAVSRSAGQAKVWVLDQQNQVQQVDIEVAELVNGKYRIVSGLSSGQQVVIEGIERLSPGTQVETSPWHTAYDSPQLSAELR